MNKITFDFEDLKKGVITPVCECGCEITRNYDGEDSEDYIFVCECGAHVTISGYELNNIIDALQ